jgi:hypothetical protein
MDRDSERRQAARRRTDARGMEHYECSEAALDAASWTRGRRRMALRSDQPDRAMLRIMIDGAVGVDIAAGRLFTAAQVAALLREYAEDVPA